MANRCSGVWNYKFGQYSVCACVCMCICVCVRACVRVCACVRVFMCDMILESDILLYTRSIDQANISRMTPLSELRIMFPYGPTIWNICFLEFDDVYFTKCIGLNFINCSVLMVLCIFNIQVGLTTNTSYLFFISEYFTYKLLSELYLLALN